MFEELHKLDTITDEEFRKSALYITLPNGKMDELEKLVFFIIDELNDLCTFCHRKELRTKIIQELSTYKKNLKQIPIGRKPIAISYW